MPSSESQRAQTDLEERRREREEKKYIFFLFFPVFLKHTVFSRKLEHFFKKKWLCEEELFAKSPAKPRRKCSGEGRKEGKGK